MAENTLPADPHPPPLRMGSIGQNFTVSEHGQFASRESRLQQHGIKYFT